MIPNIQYESLVDIKKIFSPLHMKLDLMKQFVKVLQTEGDCFKYHILIFSGLLIEKKFDAFDGSDLAAHQR